MASNAVVLLSGGLDSYTAAAVAIRDGFSISALSINYGQRHVRELDAARAVARALGATRHLELKVDLTKIGGSSLTSAVLDVPKDQPIDPAVIPSTYVPARNTIFLSLALGWAEVLGAADIFIGVNALDYSGYPDCRPEFIRAFEQLARLATRAGRRGPAADGPHAAHSAVQGRHHPAGRVARTSTMDYPQLLRPARRRPAVRTMRQLPAARVGICRGRCN